MIAITAGNCINIAAADDFIIIISFVGETALPYNLYD
jgi:hypothetical protein